MNRKPKSRPTAKQIASLYGVTPDFKDDAIPDFTPRDKPKRKRNPFRQYEDRLQKQVVKWFALQYPELRDCLCYNLSNSTNQITGVINKSLGLVTGRNDLTLYYRGKALLLELKAPDGNQSTAQKEFEASMTKAGNHYRIAWEFEQAQEIIRNFVVWCEK